MSAVIFIELLDKAGGVQERHRYETFPVRIGRGYSNALLLEDEFVSDRHGEITLGEGGALEYHDLGSANGSLLAGRPQRVLRLQADQTLLLGHTSIRLRTPDCPVPPARLRAQGNGLLHWQPGWPLALASAATLAGLTGALTWATEFKEPEPAGDVGVGLVVLLLLALWAGAWALVGRLFVKRTAFRAHLAVASLGGVAMLLASQLSDPLALMFAGVRGVDAALLILTLVPAWLVVMLQLRLAVHLRRRPAVLRSLGFFVAIGLVAAVLGLAKSRDYEPKPDMDELVEPVPTAWLPAQSPAQFFDHAKVLQAKVTAKVKSKG